ncbi:unnamed protein product, partial [Nesidiocoris tenuis]
KIKTRWGPDMMLERRREAEGCRKVSWIFIARGIRSGHGENSETENRYMRPEPITFDRGKNYTASSRLLIIPKYSWNLAFEVNRRWPLTDLTVRQACTPNQCQDFQSAGRVVWVVSSCTLMCMFTQVVLPIFLILGEHRDCLSRECNLIYSSERWLFREAIFL